MRKTSFRLGPLTGRRFLYYSTLAASATALTRTVVARRLSLLLSVLTLLAALNACMGSEPAGKAAPEWDALFQRESGWIGADGAYSIPLTGDTTLWLFSDTFVGKVKDGKRLDARMINNSIALQRGTNAPEFFYGTAADGKPASFIKPQS